MRELVREVVFETETDDETGIDESESDENDACDEINENVSDFNDDTCLSEVD